MKKLTKIEMFNKIMAGLTDQEEIDFIAHEIELLESKKLTTKKPTKAQIENEQLKADILEMLRRTGGQFSILGLQKCVPSLENESNQKISAIMKQLVDSGLVVKVYDKRKPFFSIGD
jgi:ferritin-like metal-binding protein YciE